MFDILILNYILSKFGYVYDRNGQKELIKNQWVINILKYLKNTCILWQNKQIHVGTSTSQLINREFLLGDYLNLYKY